MDSHFLEAKQSSVITQELKITASRSTKVTNLFLLCGVRHNCFTQDCSPVRANAVRQIMNAQAVLVLVLGRNSSVLADDAISSTRFLRARTHYLVRRAPLELPMAKMARSRGHAMPPCIGIQFHHDKWTPVPQGWKKHRFDEFGISQ